MPDEEPTPSPQPGGTSCGGDIALGNGPSGTHDPKVSYDPPTGWMRATRDEGPATQEVVSRFAVASGMAEKAWKRTEWMLDRLAWVGLELEGLLEYDWVDAVAPDMDKVVLPELKPVDKIPENKAEAPAPFTYLDPVLPGFPPVPGLTIPQFPAEPNFVIPTDPNLPTPTINEINFPPAPTIVFPDQPTISPVSIPASPDVQIMPWEGPDLPSSAGLDMPEIQFSYDDIGDYVSGLLTQLRDKLLDTVINGGTGLHPDVEQALYDRAFIRLDLERIRRQQEAFNTIAGRGFNLPTGVLASTLTEVENEFSRQLREVNMDILVKQAELAQQNTHFAQTLSAQIEQAMLQDWQAKAARLFEIAKVTYDYFLQYYRSRAEIYNLRVEGYKAYAQAFEARIRAELAKVEVYKGQLEGAKITMEVQKLGVDVYSALMQALSVKVELYKSQMQAAAIELEIEKFKVDIYKAQYEAFATRVGAYQTQVQAFATRIGAVSEQIRGESLKLDVYSKEVDAKSKERDSIMQGKALEIEGHKANIAQYQAELAQFDTEIRAYLGKLDAAVKENGFELQRYSVDSDTAAKKYSAEIQKFDAEVRQSSAKAAIDLERGKITIENERLKLNFKLDRLKHITGVLSQVTASALGAVNASAQIGFNSSWSSGLSNAFQMGYSDSRSDSSSTSVSTTDEVTEATNPVSP